MSGKSSAPYNQGLHRSSRYFYQVAYIGTTEKSVMDHSRIKPSDLEELKDRERFEMPIKWSSLLCMDEVSFDLDGLSVLKVLELLASISPTRCFPAFSRDSPMKSRHVSARSRLRRRRQETCGSKVWRCSFKLWLRSMSLSR